MADTGRPTVMTEDTLRLLREGFSMGFTDREACLYAGIAPSTLYDYCKEDTKFAEQKELLKENVKMIAKRNIYTEIGAGDKDISKWYVERKAKDEGFSLRNEITGENGQALKLVFDPSFNATTQQTEGDSTQPSPL